MEEKRDVGHARMEALSLFDVVKKQIYTLWQGCLYSQMKVNRVRVQHPDIDGDEDLGLGVVDLKQTVLALWLSVKNKLDYYPGEKCVIELKAFDEKKGFNSKTLTLEQAEWALELLTTLLEVSGLTRYEKKKAREGMELTEGLDETAF